MGCLAGNYIQRFKLIKNFLKSPAFNHVWVKNIPYNRVHLIIADFSII